MVIIFFPGIKSIIGEEISNGEDFLDLGGFESFSYAFVKPTNASSVIRGKGVVDGKSADFEDRTFNLSFTCSHSKLVELIFKTL